jgi:hypothetical protein
VPNLRLKEPLSTLGLTPFALKGLLNRNIKSVEDAYLLLQSEPCSYKGLGQGHIEEISQKIEAFVGIYPHQYVPYVDWESLVRTLTVELEAKERYILLSRYALQDLFPNSSTDLQEMHRWTDEQINKIYQKSEDAIKSSQGQFLQETLGIISEAFLKPFLRRHDGFAKSSEIIERLRQVSLQKTSFSKVLSFLHALTCPIILPKILSSDVYAMDEEAKEMYETVRQKAKEYFYQPFAWFPLKKLSGYLTRDFAKFGFAISERYIERMLDSAPQFVIQHDAQQSSLIVSLALF